MESERDSIDMSLIAPLIILIKLSLCSLNSSLIILREGGGGELLLFSL